MDPIPVWTNEPTLIQRPKPKAKPTLQGLLAIFLIRLRRRFRRQAELLRRQYVIEYRKAYVAHKRIEANNRRRTIPGHHTLEEWLSVKQAFSNSCAMCGKAEPFVKLARDHKIPISKGGRNEIDNIQPLCQPCNSKKGTTVWFASCPVNRTAAIKI